jgi:hypothetical protein
MPLEVFDAPADLRDRLLEFQSRQPCYPLTDLASMKQELAGYVGIYMLFYTGGFPLYAGVKHANQFFCCMPIYIGKAETPGKRTGRNAVTGGLVGRLVEHKRSIESIDGLSVNDFQFKVVAMGVDVVAWGESVLIRHYKPLWNTVLSGFGIHAPGTGRNDQMRSMWDQIHEGRAFAKNRPSNPVNVSTLQNRVDEHCVDMCNQLGCPGSDL